MGAVEGRGEGPLVGLAFDPEPRGPVVAAGDDLALAGRVGGEAHVPDRRRVARQGRAAAPVVAVVAPELDRVVVGARREEIVVPERGALVEAHGLDVAAVAVQNAQQLKGLVVSEFPEPHRLVAAARRQQRCRRVPRGALHFVLVALQRRDDLPLQRPVPALVVRRVVVPPPDLGVDQILRGRSLKEHPFLGVVARSDEGRPHPARASFARPVPCRAVVSPLFGRGQVWTFNSRSKAR